MKLIAFLLVYSIPSFSFILNYASDFQVKNHKHAKVNMAAGTCTGIGDEGLKSAIKKVIKDYWNTVSESELHLEYGSSVTISSPNSQSRSGSVLVGCRSMGVNGANGITYTTEDTGESVIFLNNTTLQPGGYKDGAVEAILAHEMGHALGLHHSKDPASVMTYESHEWGPAPSHLSQDDKDGIVYLYPSESLFLGLIGGCDAIASTSAQEFSFFDLITSLLTFAFGVLIMRKVIKHI